MLFYIAQFILVSVSICLILAAYLSYVLCLNWEFAPIWMLNSNNWFDLIWNPHSFNGWDCTTKQVTDRINWINPSKRRNFESVSLDSFSWVKLNLYKNTHDFCSRSDRTVMWKSIMYYDKTNGPQAKKNENLCWPTQRKHPNMLILLACRKRTCSVIKTTVPPRQLHRLQSEQSPFGWGKKEVS